MSSDEEPEQEVEQEKVVKKRPGRPRKYAARAPVKRYGVVKSPLPEEDERAAHTMELFYDNPNMFKRIFQTLKTMGVETVRVRFEEEEVKMVATDHIEMNEIYIRIFGRHMERYYCKRAYEVGWDVNLYEKVFRTVTQEYQRVTFVTNQASFRKSMTVGFEVGNRRGTSMFGLDVVAMNDYNWEIEDKLLEENNYPIRFCLDTREFKKHVTDGKTLTNTISFEKKGTGHLRICYELQNKRGRHNYNFINAEEICLEARNGEDDVSASLNVEYLKPLSSAMVTDKIWLAVADEKDLISTFYLDHDMDGTKPKPGTHKCEIKIVTQHNE